MFKTIFSQVGVTPVSSATPVTRWRKKQLFRIKNLIMFCLALTFATPGLYAQTVHAKPYKTTAALSTDALSAVLTQHKVVKPASGPETLEDASTVNPGDIIEYRVTYTNNGGQPVKELKAQLPIPDGLEYIPLSAKPGAGLVKAATKDGMFSAEPLMRRGPDKQNAVPYSEYRQLQWSLGVLPAKGVTVVSARARVETVIPVKALPNKRTP